MTGDRRRESSSRAAGTSAALAGAAGGAARPAGYVRLDRTRPIEVPALHLDAQQRAVVEHRDGHLLVLAGPGTGKTATLTELVVARIADPHDPIPAERILALTFGRRAAGELADRISGRLGGGPVPVVSTFHSFAYGVLRQYSDPASYASPPRLLVAAEQDARLRELLTYAIEEGRLRWPESLARAVGTRGIAEQVRALLARARGQGLDGRDLTRIGRRAGMPVWEALGGFLEEYLATLEFEGSLDYSELILRAAVLAHDARAGRALRETYRLVVVDEYQDTDPAQVALLRGLAAGGAQIVAVGDPDQAVYGFRGADPRGILRFPEEFADPSGRPAGIEVLRTTRRFPATIAEAAAEVLGPLALAPLPAAVQRLHRTPVAAEGPARVAVRTFPTASAEAAGVAEELLRAHAGVPGKPGIAWSDMAVLLRNPAVSGPVVARALRAAGIPVWLPPDELPLAEEPAVGVLLAVLGLAVDPGSMPPDTGRVLLTGPLGRLDAVAIRAVARALLARAKDGQGRASVVDPANAQDATEVGAWSSAGPADASHDPGPVRSGSAHECAGSGAALEPSGSGAALEPSGSGSAHESADLGAALQSRGPGEAVESSAFGGASGPFGQHAAPEPVTSSESLVTALLATSAGRDPAEADLSGAATTSDWRMLADLEGLPRASLPAIHRVRGAVAAARAAMAGGQMVSEVLWALWTSTDWPQRLRSTALRPGATGSAAAAHRDLDAVIALFELADRLPPQRRGPLAGRAFLDDVRSLRLPQQVRTGRDTDRDQVRLLSAHRAKGLEWQLVVVASVQEGQWPDIRLRSDLLHVAELGSRGRIEGQTRADLLAEERRLMYVACTRARSSLVVSAVAEPQDGGLEASRFLSELGQPIQAMPARSVTPMSAEGLVAALREAAQAPARVLADGSLDPEIEQLRGAAVRRLAALAARARGGGPLGPLGAADPARWWGAASLTQPVVAEADSGAGDERVGGPPTGDAQVRSLAAGDERVGGVAAGAEQVGGVAAGADRPLMLSASAVAALRDCPLRWFLEKRVGAGSLAGANATVGLVVHAVADALARGDVEADAKQIAPFVDAIWPSIPYPAHYQQVNERRRVDEMIAALLAWHHASQRTLVGSEIGFSVLVPGAPVRVGLRGSIDRVDRDESGRLHVVDFKTGRTAASAADTAQNPQLGIYQLALRLGAIDAAAPDPHARDPRALDPRALDPRADDSAPPDPGAPSPSEPDLGAVGLRESRNLGALTLGGGELVHVADRFSHGMPKVRVQAPLDEGWTWVNDLVVEAARLARGPDYPARRNSRCGSCTFRFMCPVQVPAGAVAADPAAGAGAGLSGKAPACGGPAPVPDPAESGPVSGPADRPADGFSQSPGPSAQSRSALPIQGTLWGDES
ncbi:MAG: ATP-dependent DNA helicase [Candidatus Nanopelagicales bacterium]